MGSFRLAPAINSRSGRVKVEPVSLREFSEKKDKVLIVRQTGGLGDILMHRMLFEDFKRLIPGLRLTFALPRNYWPAVVDHPFVDEVADCNAVDANDFLVSYVTTTACGRHENKVAPLADKHRSDIWAEHCGLRLTRHEMHIRLTASERQQGVDMLRPAARGPVVVLCPISAMASKNMDEAQMNGVAAGLAGMGFSPVCVHNTPVPEMVEAPVLVVNDIRAWMGVIHAAAAVVSVDTAAFHCAGGMKKPLVGMFTWADGLVYGKHFDFVAVQRHRRHTPGWDCGPCYKWYDCPKAPKTDVRKPCVTELTAADVLDGVELMIRRWPQLRPGGRSFRTHAAAGTVCVASVVAAEESPAAAAAAAAASAAEPVAVAGPVRLGLPVIQATS